MVPEENSAGVYDLIQQFKPHLLAVWRYRWVWIVVSLLVTIVAWPVVVNLPDKYESSTRLYVDTQSMLKPVLKGLAVDSNIAVEFAAVTKRTLMSRNNIERIIRESDLDITVNNTKEQEKLIEHVRKNVKIISYGAKGRGQLDNFYAISFENSDPHTAYSVVKSVLDIFVENSLGASRKDSTHTTNFLNRQISEYEQRLSLAENNLRQFKQKNINLMPNQSGGYYAQFSAATDSLRLAKRELKEEQEKEKKLLQEIEKVTSGVGIVDSSKLLSPIDERIQILQTQLDDLYLRYTSLHPNIIALEETISQLKKDKEELKTGDKSAAPSLTSNKLYQDLTVEQSKISGQVSALKVRVKEYESEIARLKSLIDTIPEVEAALAKLNRDYDINKEKYNSLVSRRESANISNQADTDSDQVTFKIIEAPKVPVIPLGPNRPILFIAVYAVSIGAGILVAWLFSQMKPTIMTERELTEKYGFNTLGSVSVVMSSAQKSYERKKLIGFILILFAHFSLTSVIIVSQYIYDDPIAIVNKLK